MIDEAGVSDYEDKTRIDLGDDLLEEEISNSSASDEKSQIKSLENRDDLLDSAKILASEGLIEDAKKIYRQVLILDPSSTVAKTFLEDLHQGELRKMFKQGDVLPGPRSKAANNPDFDSESLIRKLDEDLNLGVFSTEVSIHGKNHSAFFETPEIMDDYCNKLQQSLSHASVQDWIDLGIAYFEMDFFTIAARLFAGARRRIESELEPDEMRIAATCLLALATILSGRPHEAIAQIQPLLLSAEILHENKIELFYLMGRTYEALKKEDLSYFYYRQVYSINSHYRDIDRRLRK